jgi:hypothetical protein
VVGYASCGASVGDPKVASAKFTLPRLTQIDFWDPTNSSYKDSFQRTYTVREVIPSSATDNQNGTYTLDGIVYQQKEYTATLTATRSDTAGINTTFSYQEGANSVTSPVYTNIAIGARVKLQKQDVADSAIKLENAVFELYKDHENPETGNPVYEAANDTEKVTHTVGENVLSTYTTDANGQVDLGGLGEGYYWLKEIQAPTGYVISDPDKPVGIKVSYETDSTESVVTIVAESSYSAAMKPTLVKNTDTEGTYFALTIPNVRTYVLPSVGGPGVYPFLLVGTFIAVYALVGEDDKGRPLFRRFGRNASMRSGGSLGGD